jgi:hypothetical protein
LGGDLVPPGSLRLATPSTKSNLSIKQYSVEVLDHAATKLYTPEPYRAIDNNLQPGHSTSGDAGIRRTGLIVLRHAAHLYCDESPRDISCVDVMV